MAVPFFRRLSVRLAGLILLLGFVAVPAVSEVKRQAVERLVLQQTEVQAATATLAVADDVQALLRSVETTVRSLARDLGSRPIDAAEADRMLRNVLAGNSNLTECSVSFESFAFSPAVERFGRLACRAPSGLTVRDLAAPSYRYWTKPWYSEATGSANLTWSEPFFDAGGADANVVRAAVPFYHDVQGRRMLAGIATAGFDLSRIRELARSYDFFDTGYVVIFSQDGRLIAHPNPAYVLHETMESLAEKFHSPELATIHERVLGKRQGALTYLSGIFKIRVHENYKPVQIAGWGVVVGYAESEFLQEVNRIRWITLAALAITLAVLALIVLLVVQSQLKPLGGLTQVADEIGRGNLEVPVAPPRRDDEIGRLSQSFVLMREVLKTNRALELKVREHSANLAAANEQLTAEVFERRWANLALEHQLRYNQLIIDSIGEAVFVLTKVMNISRINPAAVHLTGFEASELVNLPLSRFLRLGTGTGPLADPLRQALKDGRDLRDQPATVTDRSGHSLAVRLSLFPLRDQDRVVGGIAILQAAGHPPGPASA
jgi:PAS domain S-box-containing protein